jgi:hypothetical protein
VEEWNNIDSMGMMQQLGIFPPLEPPNGLSVYRPIFCGRRARAFGLRPFFMSLFTQRRRR